MKAAILRGNGKKDDQWVKMSVAVSLQSMPKVYPSGRRKIVRSEKLIFEHPISVVTVMHEYKLFRKVEKSLRCSSDPVQTQSMSSTYLHRRTTWMRSGCLDGKNWT